MRKAICALLALSLLLAACADKPEPSTEGYELYYAAMPYESGGGDAIRAAAARVPKDGAQSTQALAEALVERLLTAPAEDALRSPFPAGTSLQKLTVAGGRATVDLSEQYARLSGIDLSVADACLTLTLTQLDGVYAVRITADGRELPYRTTQLMTAADALLSSGEDVIRPINVTLWFLDAGGAGLRPQQQTLALYEGQTRLSAVLDALKRGPAGDDSLLPLLPEGFAVSSSRIEENVCYVNLNGRTPLPGDETLRTLAVESLARSLLSLDGVDAVQFLVDGEAVPQWAAPAPEPPLPPEET